MPLVGPAAQPQRGGWPSPGCTTKFQLSPHMLQDRGWEEVSEMAKNIRQTGKVAASNAGKVLAKPSSTKAEKSAAASALSQAPKATKRK